jgi:Carboxypeptidase regulatory-like domain
MMQHRLQLCNSKSMRRAVRFLALCCLLVLLVPHQLVAQLSTATLLGRVADTTGAVVPHATVTVVQTDTNLTRTVTTGDDGSYRAEFLPVGPYKLTVDAKGFRVSAQSGIVLAAAQEVTLNIALQPGVESTVVNITAEVPLVNSSNSTLGASISNVQVDNLPLVSRDSYVLLNLTAGVQSVANVNTTGVPEEHVIINGGSDNLVGQVTYYLDGGLNMTGVRNTGNTIPNPDAVDQFSVETNNFSAVYGRTGAGVVSVLTKSGSNTVHGSAFYFNQETNFNSDGWLQTTRTPSHKNQFGATLGGPVLKNKIFLFGSYGGLRQISPVLFNQVVPDAAQRAGNFSENLTAAGIGGKFTVDEPGTKIPVNGGTNMANLDPTFTSLLDPVAAAVLAVVPMATPGNTQSRFIGNEGLPNSNNEYLIKGDLQLFPQHRITLDYFQSIGAQVQVPNSGTSLPGWALSTYDYRQQNANASDVWTVSSRSVNQFWASYSRMIAGRVSNPGYSLAHFGSGINVSGTPSLPQMSVSSFFTLGQSITGPLAGDNVYGLRDVFSTTVKNHTLNVGGEGYLEHDRLESLLNNYGTFTFTGASATGTGTALPDFLIGHPNTMGQDSPDDANENYWNYGFFAQDDWHVIPRLTVNLGVRYDVQTAPVDTQRRIAQFAPGVQSTVSPTAIQGQLFPGDPGVPAGGTGTNYNHFSPRAGYSFDPYGTGRTVFHGGAGLFFDTISGNEWTLSQNFQPFAVRETNAYTHVTTLGSGIYTSDPTDFPNSNSFPLVPFAYNPSNPKYVAPSSLVFVQKGMRWPYNIQANFGVQQQFGRDLAISISYVGAFSRKIPLFIDHNAPVYNPALGPSNGTVGNTSGNANCRRPYEAEPGTITGTTLACKPVAGTNYYSNAYVIEDGQTTDYNGLQAVVTKRLSHQFSLTGFYIFSKGLASGSLQTQGNIGNSAGTEPEDYGNLRLERQRTDNDQRHEAVISGVWKPNYFEGSNKIVKTVLDGWSIAGIWTMRSGKPFSLLSGFDDIGSGNVNDRPNLLPGKFERTLKGSRAIERNEWFDTSAYCENGSAGCPAGAGVSGLDGTVRENSLDAPGYKDVDASLFRDFKIWERVKFQLRGEATNVFNFVNLAAPGGTLFNKQDAGTLTSTVGVISGAQITNPGSNSAMRVIQVGGRILF